MRPGELDDSGFENFVQTGVMLTVRGDTGSKYIGVAVRFFDFLEDRGLAFSEEAFLRFLHACRKQGASGQTLEGYRASMLWLQRAFQIDPWASNPLLVRAIKGYKYADRLTRPPRGAILEPMLRQLGARFPRLAVPAAVTFYCVLRRRQTEKLLASDVQAFGDGRVILTLRADKRAKADNERQVVTRKEIVLPEGQAILKELVKGMRPTQKLFPSFRAEDLDKAVAACAKIYAWPPNLVYDGMHCLRHGGASALRAFFSRLWSSMGAPAAMSAPTAQWYSRMNELRAAAEAEEEQALLEEEEGGQEEGGEES